MPKEETYITYIKAVRNEDKLLRQGRLAILENSEFKSDLDELEQLIAINDNVKNELISPREKSFKIFFFLSSSSPEGI